MSYPDEIITPRTYADKGTSQDEDLVITTGQKITLSHYARGRETLTDGRVRSSSISVRYGLDTFTEVFGLPVPEGKYFYHYKDPTADTSILLISTSYAVGTTLNVTYEAAGDIIRAARFTSIETDLSAVETALNSGLLAFQSGRVTDTGNIEIEITAADPTEISDIICLFSDESGVLPTAFQVEPDFTKVVVADAAGSLHYLFIIKK